jgi:hypothetical protein
LWRARVIGKTIAARVKAGNDKDLQKRPQTSRIEISKGFQFWRSEVVFFLGGVLTAYEAASQHAARRVLVESRTQKRRPQVSAAAVARDSLQH